MNVFSVRKEIDQLMALASKLAAETVTLHAEMMALNAEAIRLQRKSRWYPAIWGMAFAGAVIGSARLFAWSD